MKYIREIKTQYHILKDTAVFEANSPLKVAEYLTNWIGLEDRENFVALYVDNKNRVVRRKTISIGTSTSSIIDPKEIFHSAVETKACGFIVAHNHPSGIASPSREDIDCTKRLYECGKLMGIPMLDHVIVVHDSLGYYSMKENGHV